MPLTLAKEGDTLTIKKIGGNAETRKFLSNLGFLPGESVTIITDTGGNLIVTVKGTRVAVSREMACRITV